MLENAAFIWRCYHYWWMAEELNFLSCAHGLYNAIMLAAKAQSDTAFSLNVEGCVVFFLKTTVTN